MPIFFIKILKIFLDKNELVAAKNFLEQAANTNIPEFLKALSNVLVESGNSVVARMAAGLQLKNQLTSKDNHIKQQYQQRWLSFPEDVREYVKKNVSNSNYKAQKSFQMIQNWNIC